MDNENKDELFSIRLNNEGMRYILRYVKLLKIFIIIAWLIVIIAVARDIFLLSFDYSAYQNEIARTYYQAYPVLSLIISVFSIFGLFYYMKLSVKLKNSIMYSDEKEFNSVFRYLNLALLMAIITNAISFLMLLADAYIAFFLSI